MTLHPCHVSEQSLTHKESYPQGGKSTIIIHNNNANHRKGAISPPLKHSCNNNNNNGDAKDRKLEKCNSNSNNGERAVQQQQQQQQQSNNSSRYKTELCRPFEESGSCKYGDKCQFAHGSKELRSMARHPKYKTELCRTFHSTGLCPYGPRCHFIHNSEQTKKTLMTTLVCTPAPLPPPPPPSRPKSLDSTGESPPSSREVSPTSPKEFSDLYRGGEISPPNVFFPADNNLLNDFHRYVDLPLFDYDLYNDINVFNDKRMSDLDNHSFQSGPVLELFPLEQPPLTPTSPIDANFLRLPIFGTMQKL